MGMDFPLVVNGVRLLVVFPERAGRDIVTSIPQYTVQLSTSLRVERLEAVLSNLKFAFDFHSSYDI